MRRERRPRETALRIIAFVLACLFLMVMQIAVRDRRAVPPATARTYWYDPRLGLRELETPQAPSEVDDPEKWARRATFIIRAFQRQTAPETDR